VRLLVVAKEISLEDVRLGLDKMPDRFLEHPATVLVITNLNYSEAPRLMPTDLQSAAALNWHEVRLKGETSHEYSEQIEGLAPALGFGWQTQPSPKNGNPVHVRRSVLVVYREDQQFLLDGVIPKPGQVFQNYDRVLAEIIPQLWPNENPFQVDRHQLLAALKSELRREARDFSLASPTNGMSIFRYEMHALPREIGDRIGTSTLFAAWNAAIYVNQIEDERLDDVVTNGAYLGATQSVLQKHGGLWFNDETFVISRRNI
jgi:hypothetical protein